MSSAFESNQFWKSKTFYCHEIMPIINYIILTHVIYHIFWECSLWYNGFFGNKIAVFSFKFYTWDFQNIMSIYYLHL